MLLYIRTHHIPTHSFDHSARPQDLPNAVMEFLVLHKYWTVACFSRVSGSSTLSLSARVLRFKIICERAQNAVPNISALSLLGSTLFCVLFCCVDITAFFCATSGSHGFLVRGISRIRGAPTHSLCCFHLRVLFLGLSRAFHPTNNVWDLLRRRALPRYSCCFRVPLPSMD